MFPSGYIIGVTGSSSSLTQEEHDHLLSIDPNLASVRDQVDMDGELVLVEANDYSLAPITFSRSNTPDFTAAMVQLAIMSEAEYNAGTGAALMTIDGDVSIDSAVATFSFEPTPADIEALLVSPPGNPLDLVYEVRATIGGKALTTNLGTATVKRAVL